MSPLEAVVFGVGLVLVLSSAAWRVMRRRQARRLLRRALTAPDPEVRIAAIRAAGDEGLSRHAPLLLELAAHDDDPSVVSALAQVVVDNQWEPPDNTTLVALRIWAHRRLVGVPPITDGTAREEAPPASSEVVLTIPGSGRPAPRRARRWRPALLALLAATLVAGLLLRDVIADGDGDNSPRTERSRYTAAVPGVEAASKATSTVLSTTAPPTTFPPTTAPPATAPPATAPPATAAPATPTPTRRHADPPADTTAARFPPLCGFPPGSPVDITINGRRAGTDIADARGCISASDAG